MVVFVIILHPVGISLDLGVHVARVVCTRRGSYTSRRGLAQPRTVRFSYCRLLHSRFVCVSSLRRGHANLLSILPSLTDDPRTVSSRKLEA